MEIFRAISDCKYQSIPERRQFLDTLYNKEIGAAGFKFQYPKQVGVFPDVWSYLYDHRDTIHMIFLYRENLLRQWISLQFMQQIHDSYGMFNIQDASIPNTLEKIVVNKNDLLSRLADFDFNRKQLLAFREEFSFVYTLSYEQLITNQDESCSRILSFLGLPPEEKLQSNFVKT